MKIAENNRISHRQLYRQMILAFTAPFLLGLFSRGRLLGISGMAGTIAAVAALLFYVIFLIRLTPSCSNLVKAAGGFWGRVVGLFFLSYIFLTGAYLLRILEKIVPESLTTGVPGIWLGALAAAAAGAGAHRGMQRRGRMAEVSGGFLLGGIVLMLALCLGQVKMEYFQEMLQSSGFTGEAFLKNFYGAFCAFSGLGLMPFVLGDVEKNGSAGKAAAFGVLTLGGLLLVLELILPAVFGWSRLKQQEMPVLLLMAGADLPGNVLARFDVLWMGFLLYSLLFALGSLFHYGHQILYRAELFSGRIWMPALVFFLSILRVNEKGIEDYYGIYLAYLFVPGLLAAQVFLFVRGRSRRKKKLLAAGALGMALFLSGCGIEPEKRMYPLALGAQVLAEEAVLMYGMPDLPQASGQEKTEQSAQVLQVRGKDFSEIENRFGRTQEKYLDMGHLQVLILGEKTVDTEGADRLLAYLEQEPFVGENVYVFVTEDLSGVMTWKGAQGTTVGEYLVGMYENRTGKKLPQTTLRELYHEKYAAGKLPPLPRLTLLDGQIYLEDLE